jgi:peptidoglycan hydrolase-like protein with peptidoglycan-binding domain
VKRKTWLPAVAVALVAGTATGGVVIASRAPRATQTAQEPPANTAAVERGKLSAMISQSGTLTYRGQLDGSPYSVINQAHGTYTKLPADGEEVTCGDVVYRVDDDPVIMFCGLVPAYRDLHSGLVGDDVRQLNENLHKLGYAAAAGVVLDAADTAFTWKTQQALRVLQHDTGVDLTGTLDFDDAIFLPESVRITKVIGELGGSAQPGAQLAQATSGILEVQVALDPSQQGEVNEGDRAQIVLPGNKSVTGKVDRLGRVAQVPAGQNANVADATIPAYISLDDPATARGLDRAPVLVKITTTEVENALSVPVTALVGRSGGGFAVEVVRTDGRRELVAVEVGLFDTAGGRVQVEGDLHEGDHVVVPSS